jgi:hypothetical protein
LKSFKQVSETSTATSSIVPQWLHKIAMKPKLKDMVRGYLNWRRKNPGKGRGGVQQAVKMMGLSPRDGNLLIDTLNDMVKQGKLPKHLALEACCDDCKTDQWYKDQPEWGTDASRKKAEKMTPGQKKFRDIRKEHNELDEITIGGIRKKMYKAAKFLGDVQAVKKKKVGKRIARRVAGKVTGRALGKLFK